MKPIVWTIAGSDSGGGAGIQADLKTFESFGVHGCSAITAITAQNTLGVEAAEMVPPSLLLSQLSTLLKDLPPRAIKLGMLGNAATANVVADFLKEISVPIVCDPVLIASSGDALSTPETLPIYLNKILPQATLVTPNLSEAGSLTGLNIENNRDMMAAAHEILKTGVKSVLLKGGHLPSNQELAQDFFTDGQQHFWLSSHRQLGIRSHGTGCTLSAAVTAALAKALPAKDALVSAKIYVTRGLRRAESLGGGGALLFHADHRRQNSSKDFAWLSESQEAGVHFPHFAKLEPKDIRFYPIVNSADWVEKLTPFGPSAIQLRIKESNLEFLENEIMRAIQNARKYQVNLFINDHWQLAIKYRAYGVHLGQEDLETADLEAIARAGLRLGLSSHSLAEIARVYSFRPSYIAIGAIFPTTKPMPTLPVGLENFTHWRSFLDCPVVAIGGITLDNAAPVYRAGADGVAVIRDIVDSPDPEARLRQWLEIMP